MYIRAIIKKRSGERIEVLERARGEFGPSYSMNMGEKLKGALWSNTLMLKFARSISPYANQDHAIEKIETDNFEFIHKFNSQGIRTEFVPDLEGVNP